MRRVHDPKRQWKFKPADIDKRRDWDAYMVAYDEMLERCTTSFAPWHVVPADLKWYRNLVVMRAIVDRLRVIKPEYPPYRYDPDTVVME